MKILVVSNMYPSENDPVYGTFIETFVHEISKRNKNGITELVVIRGRTESLIHKVFKYIKFYLQSFFKPLFNNYDIVYVHFLTYSPVLLNCLSLFKRLPIVVNLHGGDVLTRSKFAECLKKFNRPLLSKSRLIVSPSYYFKNVILHEFPEIESSKIYVSPSGGVDTGTFTSEEYKIKDTYKIGYVGRIDEGKGWDIFIEMVKQVKELGYNIKAEIVGRGSQTCLLNKKLDEYKSDSYMCYLGAVPYRDLPPIYSSFDLFIFPTQLPESLGLVAIEAMACGVPVVGTRIGGLQDYIKDGINGFLVSGNRAEDYCDAIKRYINLTCDEKMAMRSQARLTSLEYDSKKVFNDLFIQLQQVK